MLYITPRNGISALDIWIQNKYWLPNTWDQQSLECKEYLSIHSSSSIPEMEGDIPYDQNMVECKIFAQVNSHGTIDHSIIPLWWCASTLLNLRLRSIMTMVSKTLILWNYTIFSWSFFREKHRSVDWFYRTIFLCVIFPAHMDAFQWNCKHI